MDKEEIKKLADNSITDVETIRQIAEYTIEKNDSSLLSKIKKGFEIHGLYPTKIEKLDIE